MNEPNTSGNDAHSFRTDGDSAVYEHLQALERDIATAIREAAVLASLHVDRTRVWARESAWTVGMVAVAGLAILVLLVLAIVHALNGLCGAFAALFGHAWAGSLGGGFVGLAVAMYALRRMRRTMADSNLRRLREKYDGSIPTAKD